MNAINFKKGKLSKIIALSFMLGGFAVLGSSAVLASDINFSGFLSVGGGMVDDDEGLSYAGYEEEELTFNKNVLGIQASGTVSEKLTATVQLTSRSEKEYQVDAEWAYLSWQATENSKVRVGRIRTPFYMFSDFLDVGYSYAWVSPPESVYFINIRNSDGIDFYTTNTLGIFDTTLQVYFGGLDQEDEIGQIKLRNSIGMASTLGKDWWTLSFNYNSTDIWIDVTETPLGGGQTFGSFANTLDSLGYGNNADKLLIEDDKGTFASVGLRIDSGTFVAVLERIESNIKEAFLPKSRRQYVMGGVRFGDWLIHVTAAQSRDEAQHIEAGMPVTPQTAVLRGTLQAIAQSSVEERDVLTFGARWDVSNGAALKFQVDDIDDETRGDQKVFSVALQTVF